MNPENSSASAYQGKEDSEAVRASQAAKYTAEHAPTLDGARALEAWRQARRDS